MDKESQGERKDHRKDRAVDDASDGKEKSDTPKEYSKGQKDDSSKGSNSTGFRESKEIERLFTADDRSEAVVFREGSSANALSGLAVGGAGILLVAGAAVVFRRRQQVDPMPSVLLADEAPDAIFVE